MARVNGDTRCGSSRWRVRAPSVRFPLLPRRPQSPHDLAPGRRQVFSDLLIELQRRSSGDPWGTTLAQKAATDLDWEAICQHRAVCPLCKGSAPGEEMVHENHRMCGRYLCRSGKQRLAEHFNAHPIPADLSLPDVDYNIASTTYQPIVRPSRKTGERELVLARWGLVRTSQRTSQTSRGSRPSTPARRRSPPLRPGASHSRNGAALCLLQCAFL